MFGYGRLGRGPISLPSLVPVIETAINGELSDLHVKIDDAVLQRSAEGPGVLFRLRNIRLIDNNGQIVAQSPLAAIGMSGSALLTGRLAPGSVDFIGPRLLLFQTADRGLALSFSKAEIPEVEALRGSLPPSGEAEPLPPESVAAKENSPPEILDPGKQLDVTGTIAQVFERARSGNSSYLTRFGVRDAVVVLSRDGAETTWQVPDFSIDLQHKGQRQHSCRPSQGCVVEGRLAIGAQDRAAVEAAKLELYRLHRRLGAVGPRRELPWRRGAESARSSRVRGDHGRALHLRRISLRRSQSQIAAGHISRRLGTTRVPCRSIREISICVT